MEAAMQGGWAESPFRRSMAADWRDTPKVLLKELHHFACGYSCEDCVCGKGSPCGVAADVSTNTLVLPIVFIHSHFCPDTSMVFPPLCSVSVTV